MIVLLVVLIVLLVVFPILGIAVWTLISALVVGAIIGGLARLVIPGHQDIGFLATVVFGWVGSFVGGLIARKVLHLDSSVLIVLLEIGVAAVLVAFASTAGNGLARRDKTLRY